jgi:hypothetical protein
MLQVFGHSNLSHEPILVSVHTCQLPNVREDVLEAICQLEGLDVSQAVLDMRINDQLGHAKDLTTQMEGVTEARLLTLLGRQRLHWLQIKIVVQVQIVQVLAMDQKIEHVVTLSTNLDSSLNPIKLGALEEFGVLKCLEQASLLLRLWLLVVKTVQNPALEQLLVAHSYFDGVALWALLLEPVGNERDVIASTRLTTALVERVSGPVEVDRIRRILIEERLSLEDSSDLFGHLELIKVNICQELLLFIHKLLFFIGTNGVNDRIIIESGHLWVIIHDEGDRWSVVNCLLHLPWPAVVELRECNLILCPDWVSHNNLVDIIELIPIFITIVERVPVERLKLWPSRNGHVQCFCSVK